MKKIVIPKYVAVNDNYDVITSPGFTLKIEHSLLAISKWESKFKKPFLEQKTFTFDEFIYYIECMVLNEDELPENWISMLTVDASNQIKEYLEEYPSATVIKKSDDKKNKSKRFTTSELIYAYMAQSRVPYTAETWNIYRLLNVLSIISIDSQPKKKVSRSDTLNKYRAMNKARRRNR